MIPMPQEMFQSVSLLRYAAGSYDSNGRWTAGSSSTVTITACVQPAGMKELMTLDEGDRTKDQIAIWSPSEIRTEDESTGRKADRIYWEGSYWQVRRVENFQITPDLKHYHAVAVKEQFK